MRITESLGYKKNTLRTASSAPTEQEKRIGVVQMFDMEELREDIYYLALKNILDEECFSRQWITVPLYRDERRRFVRRDQAPLDGLFAIGRFTRTTSFFWTRIRSLCGIIVFYPTIIWQSSWH